MARFKVAKLVRDHVADELRALGIDVLERCLKTDEERERALQAKIREEVGELLSAKTRPELIEECADLIEALYALVELSEITPQDIEEKRLEKRDKVGGFKRYAYCVSVEMASNNPCSSYYLSRPEEYPEIKD